MQVMAPGSDAHRVLGNEFNILPEANGERAAALCVQSACGTRGGPAE
jgi:hypothetical protein